MSGNAESNGANSEISIAANLARAAELESISDSARLDVELLLADCLRCTRTYLYTWPEKLITATQQKRFDELFARRKNGEPVAHILGQREFWSLPLIVNNSTLIPRPDTECLVELALALLLPATARVLDLGTGTGAIALALASEKPEWTIVALDQSSAAVELATRNRDQLNLHNVAVLQSDWFTALNAGDKFDLIVSNPPYIDPQDPHLQQGDVRFEPLSALIADEGGLADIRHIAAHAINFLNAAGWLAVEHGYQQGAAVRQIFQDCSFVEVRTETDYGGNERITLGCIPD